MRSVSLDKTFIKELHNSDSQFVGGNSFIFVTKNKIKYEQMLIEQGHHFWTKFIIIVRELYISEIVAENPVKYSDNCFDSVYIDYLKALLSSNIDKVIHFMVLSGFQREECMSTLELSTTDHWQQKMACLNAITNISLLFIKLLRVWETSKSGNNFNWKMPQNWLSPRYIPGLFEEYLTSLYSFKELEENFNFINENIPWIAKIKSLNGSEETKSNLKKMAEEDTLTMFQLLKKPKENETSLEMKEKSTTSQTRNMSVNTQVYVQTSKKSRKSENIQSTQQNSEPGNQLEITFGWLPKLQQSTHTSKNPSEKGLIEEIKSTCPHRLGLFNLVQLSLPPILALKYHSATTNILALLQNEKQMGIPTWFTWWNKTFGLQYLNKIHKLFKGGESIDIVCEKLNYDKNEKILTWLENANSLKEFIASSFQMDSAPREKDYAKKASEFLLEPSVIIQLPWNTTVLHQWLVGALFEVLVFDKHSMELRHWPLPQETADIATKLIFSITRLKERILAGFAILFKQIHTYPEINTNHPEWILDIIVLPSLNALNFLISGKAFIILKSIKKLSWSKPQKLNKNWVYMPESVSSFDINLRQMLLSFCYSHMNWEEFKENPSDPFAETSVNNIDFPKLMRKLQSNQHMEKASSTLPHNFMTDFSTRHKSNLEKDGDIKDRNNIELIKTAVEIVEEVVIKPGRVQNINWELHVSEYVLITPIINSLELMYTEETSFVHLLIVLALMYKQRYTSLLNTHKDNNIISKIINLNLELSEREYIVCMTNCVSQMTEQNPVAIKMNSVTPMEVLTMHKILKDMEAEKKDRTWLWNQFPKEWNKFTNEFVLGLDFGGGLEEVIKLYENLIGKLIIKISRTSFDIYKKVREVYPYLQNIQYILPSYVASMVRSIKYYSDKNSQNFNELIHDLIVFYDTSYNKWKNGKKLEEDIRNVSQYNDVFELNTVSLYYSNITFAFEYSKLDQEIPANEHILEWFKLMKSNEKVTFDFLKSISMSIYYHMKYYYELHYKIWEQPIPGQKITNLPQFTDFFLADCVMHGLERTFEHICKISNVNAQMILCVSTMQMRPILRDDPSNKHWRVKFIHYVNGDKDHISKCKDEIIAITQSERSSLATVYNALKMFMDKNGPYDLKFIHLYPSSPPQLQTAIKYYIKKDFKRLDDILSLLVNPQQPLFSIERNTKSKIQKSISKSELKIRKNTGGKTTILKPTEEEKIVIGLKNLKTTPPCSEDIPEVSTSSSSQESTSKSKNKGKKKKKSNIEESETKQICRKCEKIEEKTNPFIVCDDCIRDEYPDINYFCSEICKNAWWNLKHKSQHLDFILQIGQFAPKS